VLKSETDRLSKVIVCSPGREYLNVRDLAAHHIFEVADPEKASLQHDRLKSVIKTFGAEVIDVPEPENHPNAVFTRDTALCTPGGYIELLPGLSTREAEGRWMAAVLDQLGEPCAGKIKPPGTVDGGDVLLCDHVAFVGLSKRTNPEGCYQLSDYLKEMEYNVRVIPLPDSILHLDKVLMPVNPERLIVCTDIVPAAFLDGFEVIPIAFNDTTTANVICLGEGELIVGDTNRDVIRRLSDKKLKIHPLDISEFVKGAGGPNCLIMPVSRAFDV